MPTYLFRDKETDEVFECFMSYTERTELLEARPELEPVMTAPALISGISGVTHKNDSGFNDMMSRIAAANPHSPLADNYGSKGIKESKTRAAVKKVRAKTGGPLT